MIAKSDLPNRSGGKSDASNDYRADREESDYMRSRLLYQLELLTSTQKAVDGQGYASCRLIQLRR